MITGFWETSLKELELMKKVEWYRLELVGSVPTLFGVLETDASASTSPAEGLQWLRGQWQCDLEGAFGKPNLNLRQGLTWAKKKCLGNLVPDWPIRRLACRWWRGRMLVYAGGGWMMDAYRFVSVMEDLSMLSRPLTTRACLLFVFERAIIPVTKTLHRLLWYTWNRFLASVLVVV